MKKGISLGCSKMFDKKRYMGIDIGEQMVACLVTKRGRIKHMTSKHPSDDITNDVIELVKVLLEKSKTKAEDVVHIAIGSVETDLTAHPDMSKEVSDAFGIPCHMTCPTK